MKDWVEEWHAESGWRKLPGTEKFSTPNGIIISEDGKEVYVAASSGFCVYRVTRGEKEPEVVSVKVAGIPDNVRLNRAKELLCNSELNISQVASEVGIDSLPYFSKIFTDETGMSPTEYRATITDQP